jgi:hypothetical protein
MESKLKQNTIVSLEIPPHQKDTLGTKTTAIKINSLLILVILSTKR